MGRVDQQLSSRPNTLPGRIERAVDRGGVITFINGSDRDPVPWKQLHSDARCVAAGLQARGICPGDHVGLLGPTSRALVTAIQACWLAGAAAVVLPLPMRMGSIEEFIAATRGKVKASDAKLVLVDADLLAFIEPQPGDPPLLPLADVVGVEGAFEAPSEDPNRLAVLQFTSGSTSDPKGVMLPHHTIIANLDGVAKAAQLDPDEDVLVSWLPLYHDMGLIGLLSLSMLSGTDLVLAGPQDFMAAPIRWLEWFSEFGGTATAGPNFSYALAARALGRSGPLDLSRWRVALNGAEPVDPDTVEAFCAAAAPHGFRPGAAFPAFGMAELAIGGTFPEPMRGLKMDCVDRTALEHENFAAQVDPDSPGARRLAYLGTPLEGLEMRICDPVTGDVLNSREVGELEFRGTSVTPGYYNRPDATAAIMREDGWMRTGDLAYLVDGELIMCGRIKDVIIVGGRNVYPEDVERAAADVDGVRAGNVIAFGVEGDKKEGIVVVAETKGDDHKSIRSALVERIRQAVGLPPKDVVLVMPGTLPKTSSGKLQRSLCRTRYLEEELTTA